MSRRLSVVLVLLLLSAACTASTTTTSTGGGPPDEGPSDASPPVPTSKVPDVVGLPLPRARTRVDGANFVVKVTHQYSKAPPGSVLAVNPAPDTSLDEGTTVSLTVAMPFPHTPNVAGDLLAQARQKLKDAGFSVQTKDLFSSQRRGTVLGQHPAAGTQLRPGRAVSLTLSTGCEPGYSACLNPLVSDYDCAGGTGDGPAYIAGPIGVSGFDPFGLDYDNDGVGCE